MPGSSLWPVVVDEDVKPDTGLVWWPVEDVVAWLGAATLEEWERLPPEARSLNRALPHLPREERVHVQIATGAGTAAEGMLFATAGLAFRPAPGREAGAPETAILCRVDVPDDLVWPPGAHAIPLGGERRRTILDDAPGAVLPEAPPALIARLTGKDRLRLQLVTPGLFGGWRPAWLDASRVEDVPKRLRPLMGRLTLRGAVLDRRVPISGWDARKRQEKPVRYAAAAGSVYFFEVSGAKLTEDDVRRLWLAPVSGSGLDRADGYGIVVPGVWE
jgi:CRISPR-associated protein Cmr3